jgi:hypothetical protein
MGAKYTPMLSIRKCSKNEHCLCSTLWVLKELNIFSLYMCLVIVVVISKATFCLKANFIYIKQSFA